MSRLTRITALITLFAVWPALAVAQTQAESLFREGNALFRSGVYATALTRYREAAASGMDTPLLYYNTGIAAYKVGQYEVAEVAFRRAQADPSLGPIATYNLGLTYRKLGRMTLALENFRSAANQSNERSLTRLAERAAESVAASIDTFLRADRTRQPPSNFRTAAAREPLESPGRLRLLLSARLGQDDNVYRTPSNAYIDFSAPGQPLVTPTVQSASFMPIDVLAEYEMQNEPRDTLFRFAYRLDGDFYESEYSNANRVSQRLEIGAEIEDLDDKNRPRQLLQSSFYLTSHDETNFDPDSGIERDFNGLDISERFSYHSAGVHLGYERALTRWTYGAQLRFEGRQYDDVALLPGYDHDLSFLRLTAGLALTRRTTLEAGLLRFRRAYDERLARTLDGDILAGNNTLVYDYNGLSLSGTFRINRAFEVGAEYLFLDRKDRFAGYFDSIHDRLRLTASYRPSRRFRVNASLRARALYYENAFAFNDPLDEFLDTIDRGGEIRAEFQMTQELTIWAQLVMDKVKSTDPRLAYERSRTMFGLLWRY